MRTFLILLNREIKAYFQSIVAYIVLAAVSLLHGVIFLKFVKALKSDSVPMALNQVLLLNNQFWLVLILIIPLITMRLFAEEQKLGTLEPLLTAPVQSWQVIFSKYVAALLFYLVLYLPYMFYMVYFESVTQSSAVGGSTALSSPSFYGGYAMIFLIGMFFVAVGCLASALTSNQIIAAVISFTVLLIYFFLGLLRVQFTDLPGITVNFLEFISPIEHMRDWSAGFFDTRPVIYYLSFAALTLALTHHVLDYRKCENLDPMADESTTSKPKSSIRRFRIGINVIVQITLLFAIVILINWLSCQKHAQWDRSATKRYSLGQQSVQVLENLPDDLYLTMAFGRASDVYPYTQRIIGLYEKAAQGKLKVRWVDPLRDPAAIAELRNQDPKLIFEQNKILISKSEKLSGSNAEGSEVSAYEVVTEKEMFQRGENVMFRDGSPRPGKVIEYRLEQALTSAIVAATEAKKEVVYIVANKGVPQPTVDGRDAGMEIRNQAAMRQNLTVKAMNLSDDPIPEDASAVILLAPRAEFSGAELKRLFKDYWEERKGGLILLIDPLHQRQMPNLLGYLEKNYGVRVENDRILAMQARGGRNVKVTEVESVFLPNSPITEPLFGRSVTLPGQSCSININIAGQTDDPMSPNTADKRVLLRAHNDFWKERDYMSESPIADLRETMAVNVAVSIEKGAGINQDLRLNSSRMIVVGNGNFMDPVPTQESVEFLLNSINWATDREELVAGIASQAAGNFRVEVGERPFKQLERMTLRIVPGLAFLIGLVVAFFRRR